MPNTDRTAWPILRRGLIAILRGLTPSDAEPIAAALFEAGFEVVEVPLNSPGAFASIEQISRMAPAGALVGAGTVLDAADVDRLRDAGGRLAVSPNVDVAVLGRAVSLGMVAVPGVFTPTEALAAWHGGASALKFFPASVLGPAGISAIRAVLPAEAPIVAVGGVSEGDFASYAPSSLKLFGLGSSLYRPGTGAAEVGARALAAIEAYDRVFLRQGSA
jgi:2-dehydro-3-deoxyphosphogalactonate aldolase